MPELAEVEVICRGLEERCLLKKISRVHIHLPRIIRNENRDLLYSLEGTHFTSFTRRGKYIEIETKKGIFLLVHLKMTGRLVYYAGSTTCPDRFERIRFTFEDGSYLIYGDTRTLGALYPYKNKEDVSVKGYKELGVEPLSSSFTRKLCHRLASKSRLPMKAFLLNQKYIAGLGNIYADEALFASAIHPLRKASTLTEKECSILHGKIRKMLRESIKRGGTTFRDYRDGSGKKGNNQKYLKVYGRSKECCVKCKRPLVTQVIGGRTTVFCEHCQK